MASLDYLRPRYSQEGARRLLADVEQAVAVGNELGDRRPVMRTLTEELHGNYACLQNMLAALKASTVRDPRVGHMIAESEAACAELLGRLGPLLRQADHVNELLAVTLLPETTDAAPRTPPL